MRVFTSIDSVMAFYRKQLAALEQRNYDHAEITNTRITPLTPDSALINKSIRRYKNDGSVLEEGAAICPHANPRVAGSFAG